MNSLTIGSKGELEDYLSSLSIRPLYRGQTSHYGTSDFPSTTTSFDRHGCIPPEMFKWWNYTSDILSSFIGQNGQSFPFVQALLQHYGWRSSFLDASTDAGVAAWFASQRFSESTALELCEDCFERGVMLRKRYAKYEFEPGVGHLYILDHNIVKATVGAIDLKTISLETYLPRFTAQKAVLVGPLQARKLPRECYHSHLTVDRAILQQYSLEHGFKDQTDLFPGHDQDPILSALMDLPWAEIGATKHSLNGLKFFRRAVDFPEYSSSWKKIFPNKVALFHGTSIEDLAKSPDGTPENTMSMRVPSSTMLGYSDMIDKTFPAVDQLLERYNCIIFEIDDLIQHAPHQGHFLYSKGVSVARKSEGLIEVGALLVEHQGLELLGAGLNAGWYYRPDASGNWNRVHHPEQCPCGKADVHGRHLMALKMIDSWLAEPSSAPLP